MSRTLFLALSLTFANACFAQPSIVETLELGHSIVMVTTELPDGSNGRGSGVVVSPEYVATNCHVLVNSLGANIAKFRDGYKPIALKANWRRDVCLLKFDPLPFKPIPMRDSSTLKYEEPVFSLGFPAMSPVPQPSYGKVKGIYPYDNGLIVRTDASFIMGSSGGALFDEQFNLIGLTTFKSPGHKAFYFSLPVEWIKELMDAPRATSLKSEETPFWNLPIEQRPFFMQVVIPYQNEDWASLKPLSERWVQLEPNLADAWYFLGAAEEGLQHYAEAKTAFEKARALNDRDLDAMIALSRIALMQKDMASLQGLQQAISVINPEEADKLGQQMAKLAQ